MHYILKSSFQKFNAYTLFKPNRNYTNKSARTTSKHQSQLFMPSTENVETPAKTYEERGGFSLTLIRTVLSIIQPT